MAGSNERPWWRLPALVAGVVATVVAFTAWADRAATIETPIEAADRLVVINRAGPITVSAGADDLLVRNDSWLLSRPELETAMEGGEQVMRITCDGVGPCRSSADVILGSGLDLVIITDDVVSIDRYDGDVTVVSSAGSVTLGPITGSARVRSTGRVDGFSLGVGSIDIATTDGPISLAFVAPPSVVRAEAGDRDVSLRLPGGPYAVDAEVAGEADIDVDVDVDADRSVQIRGAASLRIDAAVATDLTEVQPPADE